MIGVATVLAIVAVWAFLEFEPFRHEVISFEGPKLCESGTRGRNTYLTEWDGADLVIRVREHTHCGESVGNVSAQLIAGQILLRVKYSHPEGRPPAACICGYVTTVRMSQLQKRDYTVRRVGWAYP